MKHVLKQCLAALLSVVLLLTLLPATALAEEAGGANESETITADYNVGSEPVKINTDGTYTITGTSVDGNTITVESGTVTITLKGVSVTSSGCAFDIKGGNVTLILADDTVNTFESGNYYAGIHVAEGASLTIKGNGKLTAVSKEVPGADSPHNKTIGAGIGGNGEIGGPDAKGNGQDTGDNAGAITIESGTIYATSEGDGAGIGGGWTMEHGEHGRFSSITINGGTVYVKSERNGAGIGSGCWASQVGTITITGGEIHAKTKADAGGSSASHDIGAGHGQQTSGTISITGGVVYTEGEKGTGIGLYTGSVTMSNTIIFSHDGKGKVYGNATLDSDLTIHEDQNLHIPAGSKLTVSEDHTLTVGSGATLENDGILDNKGTVNGGGTVTGSGEFTGNPITMDYYVSVTVPTFESARMGDYQPEAQPITIQNKGTKSVTISSVTVNNKDFTVEPADSTSIEIQPGNTDGSYKISPNEDLSSGLHTATVTVTYDGGRKAEAEVSFMVHYFAAGEGTPEIPYQIRNLEELKIFRDFTNNWQNGGGEGMYFELTADIDLAGSDSDQWTPIGNDESFSGTFDGGGHTINGLYINNSEFYQGLFGYLAAGGTVKNLTVAGTVTCYDYGAGIVGRNYRGTVANCHNRCDVNATDTYSDCGGVVGSNYFGTVTGCYNTGEIQGYDAGGITGENDEGTVTNCYNTGEIHGDEAGGITGENSEGTVTNCYNAGEIHGDEAGGITGENYDGTVTNCYNTGEIHGDEAAGGITGENYDGTVTNCYNTGNISGDSDIGGVIGWNGRGTVTNCYYLDTCGAGGEGTSRTAAEFASGEVAYLLQSGQEAQIWGQTLASDTCPVLTSDPAKSVYKVTFQSLGAEYAVMYANPSGLAELPAKPSKSGFTFAGWSTEDGGAADFTKDSTVTDDTTVYAVWKLALAGSGTQDAPYLIPDKAALEVFRNYVNAGNNCAGLYFEVTKDIDLNNESWTPIGSNTTPFKGAFDGGDHTVSGLYIDSNYNNQGLFGKIENGTVKNLGVAGSVDGYYNVGGITGFMSGGTIENCHSNVSVKGITAVGGIVGWSEYGTIMNCYNLGAVYGSNEEIGGIVGANYTDSVVINCYNLGTVSGYPLVSTRVGGIMGNGNGSVTNCYNMGAVSGGYSNSVMGGIKGTGTGTVTNSYYLDTCGAAGDGTPMTAAQFASGEVAHLLQDGQETPVWGQTLASDTYPVLTSDPAKAVHTVTFQLGGSENDVKYVNPAGLTELPDAPEKAGFTFAGWSTAESGPVDFESGTPVTADVTLYPIYETTPSADAALRGKVTEEGGLPVAGANVTLRQGGKDLHTAKTGGGGSYFFEDVEPGIYEVVVEKDGKTMTTVVTVTEEAGTEKDLTMPDENVSSKLEVKGEDTPAVVVDGLDGVAQDNADPDPDKAVTVTMTVEAVTDGAAESDVQTAIDAIKTESTSSEHEYLNLTLEKTVSETGVGDETTEITETTSLITVVIPFDPSGKSNIVVYRYHSGSVDTLTRDANNVGEHIDVSDSAVTVYAKNFSIYAIGYTVQTAPTSYAITPPQTDHGTVTADRRSAIRGRAVTLTATPDEGCHLASLTVTDRRGKPVELTDNGDGTYTFTQPSGRVTIAAQFVPCSTLGYADLDAGAWYHDCTDYVITNALMRGVADGIFDPDGAVTRAQMATVLWNMSDKPVVNYYMTYSDVSEDAWYAEAVRWAASEGIAAGYGGLFRPNDPVTREELAVMLYRYEQKFGSGGFTGQWSYRLPFTDLEDISDWAFEAVAWCNMKGVIMGKDNAVFDPKGPAKRAELAAILTRYCGEDDIK